MKENYYGTITQNVVSDNIDLHVEEIKIQGYTVIEDACKSGELETIRSKVDSIYAGQEESFGKERLERIKELDVCRCLPAYDDYFLELATSKKVLSLVERILGGYYILNLQNAIISRPNLRHHQSSWHRDLPYQNFTISEPLALNALFAIDDFSEETGGTIILPFSHQQSVLPSDEYIDKYKMTANIKAGSAVVFDSMLYHRAGYNSSNNTRRAINHVYTNPIIKQQYDFPKLLNGKFKDDPFLNQLFGYSSEVPYDDRDWRNRRLSGDDS
ncbi:phytanoyl-CoA dioxygenase family protein [Pseudomonadota bacterium]